jgi:hypothetical protein
MPIKSKSTILLFTLSMAFSMNVIAQVEDDKPFVGSDKKGKSTNTEPEIIDKKEEFSAHKKGFDKTKLRIGPNFGVGFTTGYTSLSLSPVVGYRFIKYLEPGIGFTYQYQNQTYSGITSEAHTIGGNMYVKIYPWKEFFLYLSPQVFNFRYREKYIRGPKQSFENVTYGNVIAGIGYNVKVGNNAFLSLGLTSNIIRNQLYNNTFQIQPMIGFNFGL